MSFRVYFIFIYLFLYSCTEYNNVQINSNNIGKEVFKNKGFALVYDENLYKDKTISKKINERDLLIFQRNLKRNTSVVIKNINNDKTIIAKVGANAKYPIFNNSVVSIRISQELELDINEPYIEITEIFDNSSFVAKKAKMFDEEKQVATKVPVESISIDSLNSEKSSDTNIKSKEKFKYSIKIADFYFLETANTMVKKITEQTKITKIHIKELSQTEFRVFLGPFYDLNSLQKSFNDVNILQFENLEIIKND